MTITASAPGRCGIIGNPSDIYGGCVLSCSIPARNTCRLTVGADGPMPDDLTLWNATTARFPLANVGVEWHSEVPRSSGLSSSTAMLAATVACVLAARGEAPDLGTPVGRVAFAELVRDIELREAKVVCGYQDAYMIVHGGLQLMNFAGKHPIESGPPATLTSLSVGRTPPPQPSPSKEGEGGRSDAPGPTLSASFTTGGNLDFEQTSTAAPSHEEGEGAGLPFLLITTGVERLSGSVHGPMRDRWLGGDPSVVGAMSRITELGRLGADALMSGDWRSLAEMMTGNHRLVAELGGSGDAIDSLIADCLDCGALSAKLAGAGLGGTVIALTEQANVLEEGLRTRGYSRFLRPSVEPGLRFE